MKEVPLYCLWWCESWSSYCSCLAIELDIMLLTNMEHGYLVTMRQIFVIYINHSAGFLWFFYPFLIFNIKIFVFVLLNYLRFLLVFWLILLIDCYAFHRIQHFYALLVHLFCQYICC